MKKKWIWIIGIIGLLVIGGLIFFRNNPKHSIENSFLPENPIIFIEETDKKCITDSDCTIVSVSCDECGGDNVNKASSEKYILSLSEKCEDYVGGVCDWDYRTTHEIKCVNSNCKFVLCKNYIGFSR